MQMPLGIAFKEIMNRHYNHSGQHLIFTGDSVETTTSTSLVTQVKYVTIVEEASGLDYENTKWTILTSIMKVVTLLKFKMGQQIIINEIAQNTIFFFVNKKLV